MISRILATVLFLASFISSNAQDQVYEFRTYELEFFKPVDILHNYFEQALIPALNRQGINNVGAFEETGEALPKKIYLLITYENLLAYQAAIDALAKDEQYQQDAKPYLTASPESAPYNRISVNLIR